MAEVSVSDRRTTAELSRVLQHYCVDAASQRCRSTANILLVETPQSETEGVHGFLEIVQADNFVIDHNLGDVISQSFGATEETFPSKASILGLRSAFFNARRHHVTVLASSGDQGATDLLADTSCCFPFRVNSWPSGLGRGQTQPQPQWHIVGGTSEASPLFAGVVALANQLAGHRLGYLNPQLYELGDEDNSGIIDITKGNNSFTFCASSCGKPQEVDSTVVGFPATRGFDLASGWGTINAARFVPALAGKGEDERG